MFSIVIVKACVMGFAFSVMFVCFVFYDNVVELKLPAGQVLLKTKPMRPASACIST